MEFTPFDSSKAESSSDSTEKKGKKREHAPVVPLPVKLETAPKKHETAPKIPQAALFAEQNRRQEEVVKAAQDDETEPGTGKKKKKKKTDAQAAVPVAQQAEGAASEVTTVESTQDTPETPEAPDAAEEEPAAPDYHGELPISDRAKQAKEGDVAWRQQPEQQQQRKMPEVTDIAPVEIDDLLVDDDDFFPEIRPPEQPEPEQVVEVFDSQEDDESTDVQPVQQQTTQTGGGGSSGRGRRSQQQTTPPPIPTPPPVPTPPRPAPAPPTPPIPPGPVFNPNVFPPVPPTPNIASANLVSPMPGPPAIEVVSDRRAERRNLLTGLFVGGLVEHVRHKRRERRMEKEHAAEIKNLTNEQQAEALRAAEREKAAASKQTALEKQLNRLKEQVTKPFIAAPEKPNVLPKREQNPLERILETSKKPVLERAEQAQIEQNRVAVLSQENTEPVKGAPEQQASAEQLQKIKAEQERLRLQAEQQDAEVEQLEVPDEHRIETSAWHAIEVDKKTGKAVEDSKITYGEEFKREQHQELLKQIDEASIGSDSMRERYVQPHVDAPEQQLMAPFAPSPEIAGSSALQTGTQDAARKTAKPPTKDGTGFQPADLVLWGIFGVIVIAIIVLIAS